jgi:hypothetical protein
MSTSSLVNPANVLPAVISLNVVHSDLKQLLSIFNRSYDIKSFSQVLNQLENCNRPSLASWKSAFVTQFLRRLKIRYPIHSGWDRKCCIRVQLCLMFQQVTQIYDDLKNRLSELNDSEVAFLVDFTAFLGEQDYSIVVDDRTFAKESSVMAKESFASGLQKMFQGLGDMISSLRLEDDDESSSSDETVIFQLQQLGAKAMSITAGFRTERRGGVVSSSAPTASPSSIGIPDLTIVNDPGDGTVLEGHETEFQNVD